MPSLPLMVPPSIYTSLSSRRPSVFPCHFCLRYALRCQIIVEIKWIRDFFPKALQAALECSRNPDIIWNKFTNWQLTLNFKAKGTLQVVYKHHSKRRCARPRAAWENKDIWKLNVNLQGNLFGKRLLVHFKIKYRRLKRAKWKIFIPTWAFSFNTYDPRDVSVYLEENLSGRYRIC